MKIKFVEEVEKHDILYNYNLPGYSRKDSTEKSWHEVAAINKLYFLYIIWMGPIFPSYDFSVSTVLIVVNILDILKNFLKNARFLLMM